MKHEIEHCQLLNELKYTIITKEYVQQAVDFFFEVFLKDEPSTKSFGGYSYRHKGKI